MKVARKLCRLRADALLDAETQARGTVTGQPRKGDMPGQDENSARGEDEVPKELLIIWD